MHETKFLKGTNVTAGLHSKLSISLRRASTAKVPGAEQRRSSEVRSRGPGLSASLWPAEEDDIRLVLSEPEDHLRCSHEKTWSAGSVLNT